MRGGVGIGHPSVPAVAEATSLDRLYILKKELGVAIAILASPRSTTAVTASSRLAADPGTDSATVTSIWPPTRLSLSAKQSSLAGAWPFNVMRSDRMPWMMDRCLLR